MNTEQASKETPAVLDGDGSPPKLCIGARHTQVLLLFLLCAVGYGMSGILGIGIVAMTDPKANPNSTIPIYNWRNKGLILSAFFWGYSIPQIGVGALIKLYKPKWLLTGSMFTVSLFCILIPFMAATFGSSGVIACRVLQGLAMSFVHPSCHDMLAKWIPVNERSRMGTFVYSGVFFGNIFSIVVTGWISGSSLGWPYSFYLQGMFGMMWIILWLPVGRSSPADHPNINELERKYIETALGEQVDNNPIIPWKAILTSLPVWAIFISSIGESWGFTLLHMHMPTYMNHVLNFDIHTNGMLSAGPYLAFWLSSFIFSTATDYVISKQIVSVTVGRKIANSIGFLVPSSALLALAIISNLVSDITTIAVVLFFIAIAVTSSSYCGFKVNHIDLSPNFAGPIIGITHGLGNVFPIAAPLMVQYIVTDEVNRQQWAIVFYIMAAMFIFCNTFYIFFATGQVQSWNSRSDKMVTHC